VKKKNEVKREASHLRLHSPSNNRKNVKLDHKIHQGSQLSILHALQAIEFENQNLKTQELFFNLKGLNKSRSE
jgi:hypothetical protein